MHFFYSYLVMRIGGEHALADAKAGKDGGFKSATFVEAGKRLRELGALEPFQPGCLSTKHAESAGMFGDGKAAMDLMGHWLLGMQAPELDERQGPAGGGHRHPVLPDRSRRQGQGHRHARRHQRLARQQVRAAGGGRLPQVLQPGEIREGGRRERRPISRSSRARRAAFTDPLFKRLADDLAATTYHQNFFDQDLGPAVGRVINDVSVAVAAGEMTPEAAAAAIQDAAEQQ